MDIQTFLAETTQTFSHAGIATARLDAQVLLSDVLGKDKSWVLAHVTDTLPASVTKTLKQQVVARAKRTPLAYIRGKQEFYGRDFFVTPDVLIPRPETEEIIGQLKSLRLTAGTTLLDVGTGSGAIAVTAALELPHIQVDACDISPAALAVAQKNIKKHAANVQNIFISNLLQHARSYNIIVANLPYVSPDWQRSPETNFEPGLALFASDDGLELIKKLLSQAPEHLLPNGFLILEADPRQHHAITHSAPAELSCIDAHDFILIFQRSKLLTDTQAV